MYYRGKDRKAKPMTRALESVIKPQIFEECFVTDYMQELSRRQQTMGLSA